MKYTIISINDERLAYKNTIKKHVLVPEHYFKAFNANEEDPLLGIASRGLTLDDVWPNSKKGELGVWLSNYDVWKSASELDEDLIVFEDDAVVSDNFMTDFTLLKNELPNDWDFVALWVPENQRIDYLYDVTYELGIPRVHGVRRDQPSLFDYGKQRSALVYQGYGMVSLMYSPQGGRKLVELAHRYGITGPVDCWIYEQAHMGNLNGYAPKPDYANIVTYDWAAESHVQLTEKAQ